MPDRTWQSERMDRIRELRQWNTSEDAENMALSILRLLPEGCDVGIFADFSDVDDEDSGTGGIHMQRVEGDRLAVVHIDALGDLCEAAEYARGGIYGEVQVASPEGAAALLAETAVPRAIQERVR